MARAAARPMASCACTLSGGGAPSLPEELSLPLLLRRFFLCRRLSLSRLSLCLCFLSLLDLSECFLSLPCLLPMAHK